MKNLGKRKHEELEYGTCCLLSLINVKNKTIYDNFDDFLTNEQTLENDGDYTGFDETNEYDTDK
jgi:hypothetical protein